MPSWGEPRTRGRSSAISAAGRPSRRSPLRRPDGRCGRRSPKAASSVWAGACTRSPKMPEPLVAAAALRGVVSHLSAAQLWGLALVHDPAVLHVTVPHGHRRRRRRNVVVHRSRHLDPEDLESGLTSPVRTVLDCATTLPFVQALAVADSALALGMVSKNGLEAAATAAQGAGRGARLLGRALRRRSLRERVRVGAPGDPPGGRVGRLHPAGGDPAARTAGPRRPRRPRAESSSRRTATSTTAPRRVGARLPSATTTWSRPGGSCCGSPGARSWTGRRGSAEIVRRTVEQRRSAA